MQIFWHGLTCVRIEAEHGDREATLVTDPYDSSTGLRFPRTLAPNVVALSHQDVKRFPLDAFTNEPFLISEPGEYEVHGIFAYSIPLKHETNEQPHGLMYRFEIEGTTVGFLGGMRRALTEEETNKLGSIDILLLPVGGGTYATPKQAAETIRAIEPRIVVPLAYNVDGLKQELGAVDAFCKEMTCKRENANKLKLAKKDLPAEDLVVMVLERA